MKKFYKKNVLKIFAKFCKIIKNTFFDRTPPVAAFVTPENVGKRVNFSCFQGV